MEQDEIILFDDGTKNCPKCIIGHLILLGGPIGVGLENAQQSNILFLFKCDMCSELYKLRDEEYRIHLVNRYFVDGVYQNPLR